MDKPTTLIGSENIGKIQENLKIKVGAKISRCPERGLNMGRIACEYSIRTWELVTELVISITFYRCL